MITLVTLGFLGLFGRVYQLQTNAPPRIKALVGSQKSQVKFLGRPGNLEDRKGRLLATSRAAIQLYVDPGLIEDPSTFAEHVASDLGYDSAFIDQRVGANSERRYVLLDRRLDDTRAAKISQISLKGLGTDAHLARDYPQGALGGQIVGFRNIDGHGIEGVEKAFDSELAGKAGSMTFFRDARHHALWIENGQYTPPTDGKSVRLSIDLTIQAFAENELIQACKQYEAQSGEMVAMDPATGEILAIANYPQVDPNDFGITKPEKRRNRAITDTYEPGSTFKPFIWSMATQGRFASPGEYLNCTSSGVYVTSAGRRLHDAHPAGTVTWDEVLVKSSNIGMAIVGQRMGADKLYDAVRAFGFGTPTGTGLPGEITGKVRPSKYWTSYSITSVPMGQEVSVTAMQICRGFAAFANGGYLVSPTIRLRDLSNPDDLPKFRRLLNPQIAAHTREVLRRVVTEGTGRKADSPMYDIFGKTGTAQIAGPHGGYITNAFVASFICGAPLDDPRIVVACVIHHPNREKGHFGGTVAAPAARRLIEQSLVYMGIPPHPPEDSEGTGQMVSETSTHD
ncbi:MAG: penicillin-binding protein 2 [Planctomycetota bacterium]|nr:penicillin-binding protein 2 [Planctomycetota bacterium]